MRRYNLWVFWISIVLVAASFGGALHGLGDSLAVFRHLWALSLLISSMLLLRGNLKTALIGVAVFILAIFPLAWGYLKPNISQNGTYTLYQKNLLYNGTEPEEILADILALSPDFVTLQEISWDNRFVFNALAKVYPSSRLCRFAGVGSVAVLSKWPIADEGQTCAKNIGLATVRVGMPGGDIWLASIHQMWPFPHSQPTQSALIRKQLERLGGPFILGGDFNMVPWSYTMRAFEKVTGSKRAGKVLQTYTHPSYPLSLPIDHVLVPGGQGWLQRRPKLGSDHYGLLLNFELKLPE